MTLAQVIRQARKARKLEPVDVSSRSGIHVRTIERIEAGEIRNPSLPTLRAIARVLGCTVTELLERADGRKR